ncbi:MAG: type IA DNA topoisomerase [Lachnospiraceae bacterium]|nr:type IA DNA topoisomerase [Lachnospiraceae bacterium]
MEKHLFIAEKPSVAKEFSKALKENMKSFDGYLESDSYVVTWCVGHLVTMSYPDAYDEKLKRWSFDTIPFIPTEFKYEVIPSVAKQFNTVKNLLNRPDVSRIYVCTDSGREGEYIYRLVDRMANVQGKDKRRVWIDSQTEEEILRGIKEAKDLSEYDSLSDAAYLRAKEDYLMGINFSRVLTLKYGNTVKALLNKDKGVVSVGRVMTCVLGMVVNREREIRNFVKTPFYRVIQSIPVKDESIKGEWRVTEKSVYNNSPALYKENGFKKREDAEKLIEYIEAPEKQKAKVVKIEKKKEIKNPPLLYNLAELQNDCSKLFKISPDQTLSYVQELYEKKLVTYPRTDARVLSSAVAKEIYKNIGGLKNFALLREFAANILDTGSYKDIGKSKYTNDKQITDHYAIIPTGQGFNSYGSLNDTAKKIYEVIARRFLAIFYPGAQYLKIALITESKTESFYSNFKALTDPGYLSVMQYSFSKKNENADNAEKESDEGEESAADEMLVEYLSGLKKGDELEFGSYEIKEGETSPPKRYNSGSIILAMENAGQLIEDEELRAQIKGSGIGTSATRAEILKKLVNIDYLNLNKKTQILTPSQLGELVYDVVEGSIKPLLEPKLTASWEKGLTGVADGSISSEEYMGKLSDFVIRRTNVVKQLNNQALVNQKFKAAEQYYKKR